MSIRPDDESWSAEDLESALEQAERVLDSFDRITRELRTLQLVRTGALLAGLLAGIVSFAATHLPVAVAILLFVVSTIAGLAASFLLGPTATWAQLQRDRDLSSLVEISRVVRDVLPVVAKQEEWSELKRLTLRARIARFPISERTHER